MINFYLSERHGIIMNNNDIISFVPIDINNLDYQKYLSWLEEGNIAKEWNPEVNNNG